MKKLLAFFMLGMLLSLSMGAQVRAPKSPILQQMAASPAQVNLPANQKIMGHYDTDALSSEGYRVANNLVGVLPVATDLTSEELEMFQLGRIVAFRVGLVASTPISRVFVIPINADGSLGATTEWTCNVKAKGWNTIELETPYEINLDEGCGLRIGFDYKQTSANYALSVVNEGVIYPSYFYRNKWYNSGLDREGNLSVQCIVESEHYPAYYVENNQLNVKSFIKQGDEIPFTFMTRNNGTQTITPSACTYDVTIDGNYVATISNLMELNQNFVEMQAAVLPTTLSLGIHTLTVTTATINGEPAEYQSSISTTFRIYETGFEHQMHLIEQFTAVGCTYCPLGNGLLRQLLDTRGDIAWVGIHGQMGDDPFITSQGDSIMSFTGCDGYPTGTFDRLPGFEEDGIIIAGLGYNESYYNEAVQSISNFIDKGSEEPAWAQVNINSTYDKTTRKAVVTVSGDMVDIFDDMTGADSKLTVYITEDGLVASQLYLGTWVDDYVHNGVFRKALGSAKGVDLKRNGNSYSNEFVFTVPTGWNADNLNIVAFISRPLANGGNYLDMRVNNANKCKLGEGTAPAVMRGDANSDGMLDVGDVVAIIEYLLTGDTTGVDLDAADANLDKEHDVADVTMLITYLLDGFWE